MTLSPPASGILFVTPVFPGPTGGGANMRAWLTLSGLARERPVTMVVLCQNERAVSSDLSEVARNLCTRVIVRTRRENDAPSTAATIRRLPPFWSQLAQSLYPRPMECAWLPPPWIDSVRSELGGEYFSSAHAFKLSMAAPARALAPGCHLVLDLDDIESKAARRFAELDRPGSGRLLYLLRRLESAKLQRYESDAARLFDRITVCSEPDRIELTSRMGNKVSVLPNCVAAPEMRVQPGDARHKNLLFVGSLDYGPNQDAFRWLCTEIKASIDRVCGSDVTLRIVGRRPFPGAAALAASSGIDLVANAPDLAEHYLWASVVIVPIRSGGGTRIKILEALSYGVPVVSTTLGAEGLSLDDGKDFLRADSADEFAAAVRRILTEPGLRKQLAARGLATHASRYSPDVAEKIIAALHAA